MKQQQHNPEAMTRAEAELRAFIEVAPWRQVSSKPVGPLNKPPDVHEYVIVGSPNVDPEQAERFVQTIREQGRRGRYLAPYNGRTQTNRYLVVDEFVYWHVFPRQICRTRVEFQQHEWIEAEAEQLRLDDQEAAAR